MQRSLLSVLQRRVQDWYAQHGRTFMWRSRQDEPAPDAYVVLVSEVMLQQTQTSRVQEKLPTFLQQFPSVDALARADNATVIKAWQGMGYNNRALRLRDCARVIMERHGGVVPNSVEKLLALPGIGSYTANAIAAFAYRQHVVVLDVNIRRVYSRWMRQMPSTIALCSEDEIATFARAIVPPNRSSDWHQAVMDIGAMFCTARAPKCTVCPVQDICASAGQMEAKTPTKRLEPSFRGEPHRIWRGRIVDILRSLANGTEISASDVLARLLAPKAIQAPMNQEMVFQQPRAEKLLDDEAKEWFARLLTKLEHEKMISIRTRTNGSTTLMTTPLSTLFVSLSQETGNE
jgi:A/G-specific adenine glycosylase